MPGIPLRILVGPKSQNFPSLKAFCELADNKIGVFDASGKLLMGELSVTSARVPVLLENEPIGFVTGPPAHANALALLLGDLAIRESENRALGSEVLHLYREANLIEQLSEQLAALLDLSVVSQFALEHAQRLIPATCGSILVMENPDGVLRRVAAFGGPLDDSAEAMGAIAPGSRFASFILERGIAEIVNDCATDPRALDSERVLGALICAPLRSGQRTVGVIALANTAAGAVYSAPNLKLLNTVALQTAAAIANAILCAEMIVAAQARAAFAAELQAVSTVQQLLLQSPSHTTANFEVESVYLPASEVGGDFFFVTTAPGGSLTVLVGDVSGKGLTAAMRVAMILGALHGKVLDDPADTLQGLNNVLIAQGELGFTTACCIRISPDGEFVLANAGHIAPYIGGREVETPPSLPLGMIPGQTYEVVQGYLRQGERIVLLSDGVPEARAESGELYGFDRLSGLTLLRAREIAEAAQGFGQEDDITVLTVKAVSPRN